MKMTVFRILAPLLSLGLLLLAIVFTKPPSHILFGILSLSWVAGVLNILVDLLAHRLGWWHYPFRPLVWGVPLDIYATIVTPVFGFVVPLLFWKILEFSADLALIFFLFFPLFGLLRDYGWAKTTNNKLIVWDIPNWWVYDLLAWVVVIWPVLLLNFIYVF